VRGLKDAGARLDQRVSARRFPRLKMQHGLVVAQITLLALLLVGAGLFTQTLARLQSVPLGFNPDRVLLFDINAPLAGYPEAATPGLYETLRERFAEIPGVSGATLSHASIITAGRSHPVVIDGKAIEGNYRIMQAGPAFLTTMQIPLIAGRDIEERDLARPVGAAVVSDLFARTYFPGQNPIGRHVTVRPSGAMEAEIVGVAASARYGGIRRDEPPVLYVSYAQVTPRTTISKMTYALRTSGDPLQSVAAVQRIVREADARIPVGNIKTLSGELASTINQEIILARICDAFAAVALVIACVGLYGTIAYSVARRTREIGIRIALGAKRRAVMWMVMREVCVLAVLGLAISIPIARALSKSVESFLFNMKPNDPGAIVFATTTLLLAAGIAAYGPGRPPARRAPPPPV
jgi:macrolide transport system ATP-binding/permease protein